MFIKGLTHGKVNKFPTNLPLEITNLINALMVIKFVVDIMKYASDTTFARYKDRLPIKRISIDPFNYLGADKKWIRTIFDLVFVILLASLNMSHIPQTLHLPLSSKTRKALFPGEELLHGCSLNVSFLRESRVQRSNQGIHIGQ